jgi:hypothetical protein
VIRQGTGHSGDRILEAGEILDVNILVEFAQKMKPSVL